MGLFSIKAKEDRAVYDGIKGAYNSLCNRTVCNNVNAVYFNHSTNKYYCKGCARQINFVNKTDLERLFGHDLCLLETEEQYIKKLFNSARSLLHHSIIEMGTYKGLWSAYYVEIIFKNGKKSQQIKVNNGVRGINCPCEIFVSSEGIIYVQG